MRPDFRSIIKKQEINKCESCAGCLGPCVADAGVPAAHERLLALLRLSLGRTAREWGASPVPGQPPCGSGLRLCPDLGRARAPGGQQRSWAATAVSFGP